MANALFSSKWKDFGAGASEDDTVSPLTPDNSFNEVSGAIGGIERKNRLREAEYAGDAITGSYNVKAAQAAKDAAERWAAQQRSANTTNQLLGLGGKILGMFLPKIF